MDGKLIWWIPHRRACKVPHNLMPVWVVNFAISSTANLHITVTKKMFIVNRFVCLPSFLVQKGAGSSSFSPSLQRNHINGLQLQAEFSTNTCVSLSVFCIISIIKIDIYQHQNLSCSFLVHSSLMEHAKEIRDRPVLELYYVLKMGARCIFCTSN
jgi:hypothetical protein